MSKGRAKVIPIEKSFVTGLIQSRWDSITELEKGWIEQVESGQQKIGTARNRATIYRWLAAGLPDKADDIFGFAATLGVDPLVLFDIEGAAFQRLLSVEWVFYLTNMQKRGRMSSIWPLVRPSKHWPSMMISLDYYGCNWTCYEFRHPGGNVTNVYANIRLTETSGEDHRSAHRIYYFAYRRDGARDELWRPYGIVRKRGDAAICIGHNGDMLQDTNLAPRQLKIEDGDPIDVETFFGPEPCEFKVACLHPFEIELEVPSKARNALRFRG